MFIVQASDQEYVLLGGDLKVDPESAGGFI